MKGIGLVNLLKTKCPCGREISHRLSLTLLNFEGVPYTSYFYLCESCAEKNKHDLKLTCITRPSYIARIRNVKTGLLYAEELRIKRGG